MFINRDLLINTLVHESESNLYIRAQITMEVSTGNFILLDLTLVMYL